MDFDSTFEQQPDTLVEHQANAWQQLSLRDKVGFGLFTLGVSASIFGDADSYYSEMHILTEAENHTMIVGGIAVAIASGIYLWRNRKHPGEPKPPTSAQIHEVFKLEDQSNFPMQQLAA